jgi:type IV pilus assembly protein PilE
MKPICAHSRQHHGMTLIELLVVLVIVAVLAAISWPSLRDAIYKSRRSDAMQSLARVAQAQERYRSNHPEYTTALLDDLGIKTASSEGYYTLSISLGDNTGSEYTVSATANTSTAQGADTQCRTMSIKVIGAQIEYKSSDSAGKANAVDHCWAK